MSHKNRRTTSGNGRPLNADLRAMLGASEPQMTALLDRMEAERKAIDPATITIRRNPHAAIVPNPVYPRTLEAQQRNCERLVRERAYFLWVDAGRPEGRDLEFWLDAERRFKELTGQLAGTVAEGTPCVSD
jgi:hypothetical protein